MSLDITYVLLYVLPALVIGISLHEMMHGLVGYWLGDDTAKLEGRISLNPLRHVDPLTTIALPLFLALVKGPLFAIAKPVPINMYRLKFQEFGMAIVAVAGPLTNLLLAIVSALLIRLLDPAGWVGEFLVVNIVMNTGIFIFNMIPFPPLDGSRVLYALAPESVQNFMMQIERMGFTALLLFMFVGYPLISPLISSAQQMLITFLLA